MFAVTASVILITSGLEAIRKTEIRNLQMEIVFYVFGVLLHQGKMLIIKREKQVLIFKIYFLIFP